MKRFLFLILLVGTQFVSAQDFYGYQSDNYSGLHGVTINPANIVGSKFRTEINLASFDVSSNNDYYALDFSQLFESGEINGRKVSESKNNNFAFNAEVMGPSFMFNLSPKHSIGLITKVKSYFNINEINGGLYDEFEDDFSTSEDFSFNEDSYTSTVHAWGEIGLAYGRILIDKEKHRLKAGVTLKYLIGAGNAYSMGNNISVNFDADGFTPGIGTIASTGQIEYGSSTNEDGDFDLDTANNGFGTDIGFVYEWKQNVTDAENESLSQYKLKAGISFTDIGSVSYKQFSASKYDITNTIDENTYNSQQDFEDKLENFYTEVEAEKIDKVSLPSALHATVDYNINNQFYLNLRTDLSLNKSNKINTNTINNAVVVTPRFERKWFSAYLPLSYLDYSGFNAGLGFRAGPLFVGSNTAVTNLLSNKSKAVNVYAGIKIPIYKKGKSTGKQ